MEVKIYCYIDNEWVTFHEFFGTILASCDTPFQLSCAYYELFKFNQVNLGCHNFKIKKIYGGIYNGKK